MTYAVTVTWDEGDDDGKVLAFVQAPDLKVACADAELVVRKVHPNAIVNASAAREMNQTVVLIPDGEKARWLTSSDAGDTPGQTKLPGTGPGDGAKTAPVKP